MIRQITWRAIEEERCYKKGGGGQLDNLFNYVWPRITVCNCEINWRAAAPYWSTINYRKTAVISGRMDRAGKRSSSSWIYILYCHNTVKILFTAGIFCLLKVYSFYTWIIGCKVSSLIIKLASFLVIYSEQLYICYIYTFCLVRISILHP